MGADRELRVLSALLLLLLLVQPHVVFSSTPPFACDPSNPSTPDYAFCKSTLPIDKRVSDLVSRLTLDEKISQLGDIAPAIPRLGVPSYKWWSEALHAFPKSYLPRLPSTPGYGIASDRDPRWGRGQETPGEDPMTASKYAVYFVRGLQGDSFRGRRYIASDCDAVALIYGADGYAKSAEDAVADVLKAGMDLNCGDYVQKYAGSAVKEGKLSESEINRALHNLFSLRMRLGLFNASPKHQASGTIFANQICSKEHQDLALEAAQDGVVLLKNTANLLPLARSKVTSLGVIGPNANVGYKLLGNYGGPPCKGITPLGALQTYVGSTRYVAGCDSAVCTSSSIDDAVQLAKSVDYVIMFMGLDQDQEREDLDRVDLVLPGMQQTLVSSVAGASKRPIILVLLSGGPVDITFAKLDGRIGGILWAGYPGEAGGLAIARIIFGEHNPGEASHSLAESYKVEAFYHKPETRGRLPVTWYPQEFTRVPMTDMRMRADAASGYPGRTYRFYTGKPVYRFGYGLSYTTYSYEFEAEAVTSIYLNDSLPLQATANSDIPSYNTASIGSNACGKLKLSAAVSVKNHGPMAGKHPVLLFSRWPSLQHGKPVKQLIGFKSVHLEAGEITKVVFSLWPCRQLSRAMGDGTRVLDGGSHFLVVGEKEHEINIVF
ncbi:hypothetical protein B296_00051907 [Ensete ventricosum]|uniref:Fibronectin type III-like domain-containing protein n=1 Tax=Ensete ventricosum TaxID=4639 RepID=A0A426X5Y5_ENSVE|nr:hypothetical protein B296_00051907 [Ensete ventricosum]